jgi:AcrR family transcriptional regulator
MARPKNEKNRNRILEAAIRLIAQHGLTASTAAIAKKAKVANGSLFVHFETKTELINATYLLLKDELNLAVLKDLPATADVAIQFHHIWNQWIDWGTSQPSRRSTLAQLSVSDKITEKSRTISSYQSAVGVSIVRQITSNGALKDSSIEFVGNIIDSFVGATIDYIVRHPTKKNSHRKAAFEALLKALQ